jgi:surfactin synthase thioesterase subunit
MEQAMSESNGRDLWVRVFHRSPAAFARLVCFPHAGGSASYYAPMSGLLQPDIEVAAVQYPGRQDRLGEQCVDDIGALADRVFDSLRRWDDKPFAFFGHSMGAVVAYETARRVARKTGQPPEALFVSATRNPSYPRGGRAVHLLDDEGLIAELRRVSGPDQDWLYHTKLLAGVLPVIRSDYKAIETYAWSPGPPLDCPIIALVGDDDPYTTPEEMASWSQFCTSEFLLKVLVGGHFYLEVHSSDIAEIIAARLRERVQRPKPPERPGQAT